MFSIVACSGSKMKEFTMWTLLVLCSVITSHGVQGAGLPPTTEEANTAPPKSQELDARYTFGVTDDYYWTTDAGWDCGGYLYGSSGTFQSPNYPNPYPHNAHCTWYIRPGRQIIQLEFPSIEMENQASCPFDYIYVYDGSSTSSRILGKVCDNNVTFHSTGAYLTVRFRTDGSVNDKGFRANYHVVSQGSCRYNCGYQVGTCSCYSGCEYGGNCCPDYGAYCSTTTMDPYITAQPSCRNNCGYNMGSCSCSSSCQYYGNCCYDYYSYCLSTTDLPIDTTAQPSCQYNCGYNMGSCSCSSSCQYYGTCCYDYYSYCLSTTDLPIETTAQPSCQYNCGRHLGSCSCSSSCEYNGNCCYDYYSYCSYTTDISGTETPCGGHLYGSGNISSPNHPNYYHDHAYCVWQLRASYDQRIYLAFTYLQLENCCTCDYIAIYDGPSVNSQFLGKVCNDSQSSFYSSSNYMTVLFRTDSSVVGRGFKAEFMSSLQPSSGRVDCSSDNMNIVIQRSYLNSLGYDGHSLYVNDPHCRPQVSSYQVVFSFPINTCGTVRKFENGRAVYTNTLRAYTSSYGEITRQTHLKLNVACRMEQDSVSQIMYVVNHHDNSSITGTGRFNTSMAFYTSSSFYYKVSQVPYEVSLNQNLYVQVDLRRGDSSLVVYLDTCVASPSPHDFQTRSYDLVRNGCSIDSTYRAYLTGTHPYARFAFKSFKFLRATESVYIQCKVLICQASDYNSRCRHGCNRRQARDLGSEHDSQTLVLGPIKLKDLKKKEDGAHKEDKV
ncbi:deleted in malignant brain tumors 1 protein isoform X1 [Thunnus maccoyii]|uniref:deleted in malignant brain tumors 1 protein isoform X1 n=2 Tax=Thunnus maccoyii TaxID=8240 RepID=UPI001C4C87A6|nr:deleted in malignant brain tumors 1 protein isoform X1 [Thunnus maccoyii]